MPFKKQQAGSQRTLIWKVRLKPQFRDVAQAKLDWLRSQKGYEEATYSDLIRLAIDAYCRKAEDPREA